MCAAASGGMVVDGALRKWHRDRPSPSRQAAGAVPGAAAGGRVRGLSATDEAAAHVVCYSQPTMRCLFQLTM